ncbi:toll/interleukin-1 receptor domain-containing protein [Roseateles sp. DB2]|uniref:toll/interleukin-1 receptor domain-containing protein n=1 Tax=Roseateles sp. DB2 TaxID=3453717 RepID=UPI003EEA5A08
MTEPGPSHAQDKTARHPAFISYSHADKAFARRLHSRLESYKLPQSLLAAGEDARLARLYIDHAELGAASDLPAAIEQALAASDCLVVVVSPQSLQSRWVQAEVRAFRALHPDAPILCIAAPGHGGLVADPLFEGASQNGTLIAMPRVPLVVNTDEGFEDALLAIVAKLRGRDLEQLRNREQQRQRRARRIWTAVITSVSGLILVLGLLSFAAAIKADREKNRALVGQSELLAAQSADALRAGDATLATRLALAALPTEGRERPYAWQASVALSRAAQHLRERSQARHPGEKLVLYAPSAREAGWRYALSRTGQLHLEGPDSAQQAAPLTESLKLAQPEIDMAYYARRHALIIALGGRQIVAWSEKNRTQSLKTFDTPPACMTVAPDGDTVTVTLQDKVEVLQLPGMTTLHELPLAPDHIGECAAYSEEREQALVVSMAGNAHQATLLDTRLRKPVQVWALAEMATVVTMAPGGQRAAIALGDGTLAVVDLAAATLRKASAPDAPAMGMPASVAFDDEGLRVLAGDNRGRVHVFDAASLQRSTVFAEHADTVASILVDKGFIHTAGHDGVANTWSFGPLLQHRALQSLPEVTHARVASASGRYIAAAGRDGTVLTWDLDKPGGSPAVAQPCRGPLRALALSDTLRTVAAGCENGEIRAWSLDSQALVRLHRAEGAVLDLRYGTNSTLLFAAADKSFGGIYPDGMVTVSSRPGGAVAVVEVPGTSQVLVVDEQGDALVHELKTGRALRALKAPGRSYPKNQNLLGGVVTGNGRYAAVAGSDDHLRIWDLADGGLAAEFPMNRAHAASLAVGPADQIAFIREGKVHVWSPAFAEPQELKRSSATDEVAFLPGQAGRIATSVRAEGQWQVWLWDLQSGTAYALIEPGRAKESPSSNRLLFCGPGKSQVAISTPQGPVLAPLLPYTSELVAMVRQQAPAVSRPLAREDLKRFFLPMESILDTRPEPVLPYAPLENLVEQMLGWVGRARAAEPAGR